MTTFHSESSAGQAQCVILSFMSWPVAISTWFLMVISVDRYVTVKYPRPVGKFRQRRHSVVFDAMCILFLTFLITFPILTARKIQTVSSGNCVEVWSSDEWRRAYLFSHLMIVYILPAVTVVGCHLAVRAKLTALSLTARAAHGELPLPMPLLRRPTHVIIVAGIANNPNGKVLTYRQQHDHPNSEGSSNDEGRVVDTIRMTGTNQMEMDHFKRKQIRKTAGPKAMNKTERELREENRKKRPGHVQPQQPVTTTLRSRRRLANILVSVAAVFAGCWLPHVVCSLYNELCSFPSSHFKYFSQFSLLLGHAHSAINPVVYWVLNHQSLQHSCTQVSFLGNLRLPALYKNASSTNEAALGPFNPLYARPVRPPAVHRQSSHYLY